MNQLKFVINEVRATGHCLLQITFADGLKASVDLFDVIIKHPTLARLINPEVFQQVVPDEWSRGIVFCGDDDLTLASDNLRELAMEQACKYSHLNAFAQLQRHGPS